MSESRLIATAMSLAIVLLVAGLTYFSAILLLPNVATKDAYDLLVARSADKMTLLEPTRPGDHLIPFRDPATVQGLCFFDLTKAPVRVRTKTEQGRLLTLSFRMPNGRIFYSMTDRAALHETIDIRIVTDAQLKVVEDGDDEDDGLPSELRLKAPALKGLMVATALIARPSERKDAEERIKGISCVPEPLPPPS